MPRLWIVDRNPRRRAALARLAAAAEDTVLGAPGDPRFESAPPPETVLLGLDGDWELELQFAHAIGRRAADALWILIGESGTEREALGCFDTRRARFLAWPPRPEQLRGQLAGVEAPRPPSLSERARRDALSTRFARWFGDLDLPDLLRALDPRLAEVPLRIVGEPGSGRGLIARYVHLFGGTGRGALAHVPCDPALSAIQLAEAVAGPGGGRPELPALGIWLEDVERLCPAVQRALRSWLECGLPPGTVKTPLLRWIATSDERHIERLDPDLRLALSGLVVRLPTLRERPHAVSRIATESVRAWCAARGERTRRLGEDALQVLEEYPWPGNLRELEAVIVQSLTASPRDPLGADDLWLDGIPFAPTSAREMEALLPEEPGRRGEAVSEPAAPRAVLEEPLDEVELETFLERLEGGGTPAGNEPVLTPGEVAPSREIPVEEVAGAARPSREATGQGPIEALALGDTPLARLVGALERAVRNPLATVRAFAAALPERFQDQEFRERFVAMLRDDVGRVDALIARLAEVARLGPPRREKVDVSALLEELLEGQRARIRDQRLLVLKELDTQEPHALCDAAQLRFALDTLLTKCLGWVPPHGDVYLASRHHAPRAPGQQPSVRVLIRFHEPAGGEEATPLVSPEGDLELMIAELVVRAQGGSLGVNTKDGDETVVLLDLPAP